MRLCPETLLQLWKQPSNKHVRNSLQKQVEVPVSHCCVAPSFPRRRLILSRVAELVPGPVLDVKGTWPCFSQLQCGEMGNMRKFCITPLCVVIQFVCLIRGETCWCTVLVCTCMIIAFSLSLQSLNKTGDSGK